MFGALKKILGFRTTNHSGKGTSTFLFSGSAYFSKSVPSAFAEKWGECQAAWEYNLNVCQVVHGGEISSGTTLDVRARYFFATDPSEPWVTRLFANSVVVIHAGWIVHCIDEAFLVPVAQYILDDQFVPGAPYRSSNNTPIFVPLSEAGGVSDSESEFGPTPNQTSDTPSTPTSTPRKRTLEQAYFDSPSGSLVFSGFDKYGMPRRPRKQRKLLSDLSFSPERGRSGAQGFRRIDLDWHQQDEVNYEYDHWEPMAQRCLNPATVVRSPDTPDKPLGNNVPTTAYQASSVDAHFLKVARVSPSNVPTDMQKKTPPVRTIDFTNLPPSTRRFRFPETNTTKSGKTDTIFSIVKHTDHKVRKKISFANEARVCVYMVSPERPNVLGDVTSGLAPQPLDQDSGSTLEVTNETKTLSKLVGVSDDSTAGVIKDSEPRTDSRLDVLVQISPRTTRLGFENGTNASDANDTMSFH